MPIDRKRIQYELPQMDTAGHLHCNGCLAVNVQQKKAASKAETKATEGILTRVSTKEEKKAAETGGVPATVEQQTVQKFQSEVIPDEKSQENPFMQNFTGDDK